MSKTVIISLILFGIFVVLALGVLSFIKNRQKELSISNFEECVAAGNPVMESYPAQCSTRDGQHFVQELTGEEKRNLIPPQKRYEE